jgi:serine/threonine protein kinase
MHFLHERGVAHTCIGADTIVIDPQGAFRLVHFGSVRQRLHSLAEHQKVMVRSPSTNEVAFDRDNTDLATVVVMMLGNRGGPPPTSRPAGEGQPRTALVPLLQQRRPVRTEAGAPVAVSGVAGGGVDVGNLNPEVSEWIRAVASESSTTSTVPTLSPMASPADFLGGAYPRRRHNSSI